MYIFTNNSTNYSPNTHEVEAQMRETRPVSSQQQNTLLSFRTVLAQGLTVFGLYFYYI